MNCIEARRKVTPFIKQELPDREVEQFLDHVEHCPDCMDELETYYMVYKTLDTLESSSHRTELDFKNMLENDIREVRRNIINKRSILAMHVLSLFIAELLILFCIFKGFREPLEKLLPFDIPYLFSAENDIKVDEEVRPSESLTTEETETDSQSETESQTEPDGQTEADAQTEPVSQDENRDEAKSTDQAGSSEIEPPAELIKNHDIRYKIE